MERPIGPNSLVSTSAAIARLRSEIQSEHERHMTSLRDLEQRLKNMIERRDLISGGLNLEMIDLALATCEFEGNPTAEVDSSVHPGTGRDVRKRAIEDAVTAFSSHEAPLKGGYIGVKNFGSFGDQRHDGEYGFGPRHGSIVMRIGLNRAARERALTDAEREAVIYYLLNWHTVYTTGKKESA